MVQLRLGSHVADLVAMLSFVGEFPFQALDMLGSRRVYKALVVKLTRPARFRNSLTGKNMTCRLFTLNGGDRSKTVRLYKQALPILRWIHPEAYQYYLDSFWSHYFPGDRQHLDRNHRVAEAAALCMRAGLEARPYILPELQNGQILSIVPQEPSLYLSRDIKRASDTELNKTSFTRMVGAVFGHGNCYAVYNTRKAAMKWNGMGELKTLHSLIELGRLNAGIPTVNSAILFGASGEIALQSFSEKGQEQLSHAEIL